MLDREMAKNTNLDKDMEEEMEGVEDSEEEDDSGRKRKSAVYYSTHILDMPQAASNMYVIALKLFKECK